MTWVSAIGLVVQAALLMVAFQGLRVARQRFIVADRNRLEDQFIVGAEL